ncbi:DUF5710 domain-containing protein [Acidovorax sp. Root217]|uniref:DUF5710 domain-containing protein n=1 Tax=Acidovorax sp. Root217 TaxID=1736492 RepID=UPI000B204FF2|nr:DUF5710 domain-containing protein [Acidovorax sp. Root217]
MSGTYLVSVYKDRDRVNTLGARWDPARKQWYVPDRLALTPFAEWLPAAGDASPSSLPHSSAQSWTRAAPGASQPHHGASPCTSLLIGVASAVA